MTLKADFDKADYTTGKINDFVLSVSYPYTPGSGYKSFLAYDFLARVMTIRTGSTDGGVTAIPFAQLDPDSLETMRQRLIVLGGHPPALQPENGEVPQKSGPALRP